MTIAFFAIAAAMLALAMALVLVPLIRHGRNHGRPRSVFAVALVAALVLPLAAAGLYAMVGNLNGLNPLLRQPPQITVDQAVAKIKERLAQNPDDVRGWTLLGQSYSLMGKPADAREAFGHALKLEPDDPNVMVAWAEADSLARPDHQITGKARTLLQKAVAKDPHAQRALWLLGISDYQAGDFVDAALTWRRLSALLPSGTKVANAVEHQIALANARARGLTQAQAEATLDRGRDTGNGTAAAQNGPQLKVKVRLAPALKDKLKPGDVLFVFARAPKGPPMPLAVVRQKASSLPAEVTLTDGMGMNPDLTLSSVPRVMVVARISHDGKALPEKGDLEGSVGPVAVGGGSVVVTIDHQR